MKKLIKIKDSEFYYVKAILASNIGGEVYYTPVFTPSRDKAEDFKDKAEEYKKMLDEEYKMLGDIRFEILEVEDEKE